MAKRARGDRGWAYPSTSNATHFLLDVNSIENSKSAVEFEYTVSDKIGSLSYNGKLNLRASDSWSVALSNFSMPNNFETFPSIDRATNLSAAFVSLHICTHYTYNEEDIFHTVKLPVKHFPHGIFTGEEIIRFLISLINEGFLSIGSSNGSGATLAEGFWKEVADFGIDPQRNFVYFKARKSIRPHPFQKTFHDNVRDGVLPHPKKDISNFILRSAYIWAGEHVVDHLGSFDFAHLWDHRKLSGVTFHGEILDKLIFSYLFAKTEDHTYLVSKEPYKRNKHSLVHVKSDLIVTEHSSGFGNLTICPIPGKEEKNVSYMPPKLIWRPVRGPGIERIKFRLTDERGHLLNYSGGYASLTLLFSPTDSITF